MAGVEHVIAAAAPDHRLCTSAEMFDIGKANPVNAGRQSSSPRSPDQARHVDQNVTTSHEFGELMRDPASAQHADALHHDARETEISALQRPPEHLHLLAR